LIYSDIISIIAFMNENILTEFFSFLDKSATLKAANEEIGTNPPPLPTGKEPRHSAVDQVNNTQAPGLNNPSHGGAGGMPLKAPALKPVSWNKPS
jgi:hypothetical protein